MATHDYVIDNQSAPAFRSDLNNVLQAIVTQNSSTAAPTTTYPDMIWYDTAANQLKKRNEANSAWITLGTIDEGLGTFTPTGTAAIASQAEAEAGTDNTKVMTPLRVLQAMQAITIDVQEFATAGSFTWTKPANAIYSEIIVVGGGGGGSFGTAPVMCGTSGATGSGGAAGGAAVLYKIASALGATETVTVGSAGTAGTSGTAAGTGGTSSLGTHASATGGGGGQNAGGVGSGTGAQVITGELGAGGIGYVSGMSNVPVGSQGGQSYAGPGGRSLTGFAAGTAGTRGGGGGGGPAGWNGGAGGAGYVRVVTYCA